MLVYHYTTSDRQRRVTRATRRRKFEGANLPCEHPFSSQTTKQSITDSPALRIHHHHPTHEPLHPLIHPPPPDAHQHPVNDRTLSQPCWPTSCPPKPSLDHPARPCNAAEPSDMVRWLRRGCEDKCRAEQARWLCRGPVFDLRTAHSSSCSRLERTALCIGANPFQPSCSILKH